MQHQLLLLLQRHLLLLEVALQLVIRQQPVELPAPRPAMLVKGVLLMVVL